MTDIKIDLENIESLASQLSAMPDSNESIVNVDIDSLKRGKFQPRTQFNPESLKELAESIKSQGVIQPLLVRKVGNDLEIVAGERRWRAAEIAGLKQVACVVRDISDRAALAMALIENIDRENLSLVDESNGVAGLVHETNAKEAAKILGKTAQWISKRMKIARSPSFITDFINVGYSRDTEGFYLLSRLAESDAKAAKKLIEKWEADPSIRLSLRAQVQSIMEKQTHNSQNYQPPETDDDTASESNENNDDSGKNKKKPERKKSSGRPKNQKLPPIVIKSAKKTDNILEIETDEGLIQFEISDEIRNLILEALK